MLSGIYNKFQNVQDQISSSFRELKMGETLEELDRDRSVTCGSETLARHQESWREIHDSNEKNARNASLIDSQIRRLYARNDSLQRTMNKLESELNRLEEVTVLAEKALNEIGGVRAKAKQVETLLNLMADNKEIQAINLNREKEKLKVGLYRDHKLEQLDSLRENLAAEHEEKIKLKENTDSVLKKAKYNEYDKMFKKDMETYKSQMSD